MRRRQSNRQLTLLRRWSRRLNADTDEEGKLLAACNPHLRACVLAALETGIRRGEILRLSWLDVDLENGSLCARSRKQSRTQTETVRRIDLHPELKEILSTWREKRPKGQFVVCKANSLEPLRAAAPA